MQLERAIRGPFAGLSNMKHDGPLISASECFKRLRNWLPAYKKTELDEIANDPSGGAHFAWVQLSGFGQWRLCGMVTLHQGLENWAILGGAVVERCLWFVRSACDIAIRIG